MKFTTLLLVLFTAASISGCKEKSNEIIEDWASGWEGVYHDDTKPNVIEVAKAANQTLKFLCDYCEGTGQPHLYLNFSNVAMLTDSTFTINERLNGVTYKGGGEFSGNRLEYKIEYFDSSRFIIVGTTTWFRGQRQ